MQASSSRNMHLRNRPYSTLKILSCPANGPALDMRDQLTGQKTLAVLLLYQNYLTSSLPSIIHPSHLQGFTTPPRFRIVMFGSSESLRIWTSFLSGPLTHYTGVLPILWHPLHNIDCTPRWLFADLVQQVTHIQQVILRVNNRVIDMRRFILFLQDRARQTPYQTSPCITP